MLKILIAEDDDVNRNFLSHLLRALTKDIVFAANGIEAVSLTEANTDLDMILMDINMPVMDGVEAMKEIKRTWSKLPIIAVTAYGLSHDKIDMLQAGFNDYLPKPFPREQLLDKILKNL